MPADSLTDRFLARAPDDKRGLLSQIPDLEVVLETLLTNARSQWSTIALDDDVFLAHVAERLPDEGDLRKALLSIHAADLYLACGCLAKDDVALAEADTKILPSVIPALQKVNAPDAAREDAIDRLRHVMLFGEGEKPPKIAKYSGRGPLRSWLSVAAVRDLLGALRSNKEIPVDEDALVRNAAADQDPALTQLKKQYRKEFAEAFTAALAALSSRERVLLRHYYIDGLGSDVLAKLHRVHRVTITRWLNRIKENLLEETRFGLAARLRVSGEELESIMRLIQSQLHVSIQGMLGEAKDVDE